jgi:glycerophosphoryl diester phosphodiesterase
VPVATPAFIRAAHRLGLEVHVWTVDDAAEVDRLLDLGVEGFVTDRPDVLRAVLQRRGSWSGPV